MRPVPLARLFAMAYNHLVERLHVRLAERGWPDVPRAAGYVLLATRDGPATGTEIAQLMRTSKQAASKLLDTLERRGLIERAPDRADARVKSVRLSATGHDLLTEVERIYQELEAEWADLLGAGTVEDMRSALTTAVTTAYGGRLPAISPG